MDVTKCDRCGKYIDKTSDELPRVSYRKDCQFNTRVKSASLCNGCYENFNIWLNLNSFDQDGGTEDANND